MPMIYTTYFANLRNLPKNIIPISICAKAPSWYTGLQYKKLAPSYSILMEYKSNPDEELYTERFNREILSKLNPNVIVDELYDLADISDFYVPGDNRGIALVCYEKPSDFCHRHLVADWLLDNGYNILELEKVI